jgi:hypothetical protein
MITICREVYYLYIRLLTQLLYLTNMRFFNIPLQSQGAVLTKYLSLITKESSNILAKLNLACISAQWLVSRLRDSMARNLA